MVFRQKDANGIENSEAPDQGLHCLPRPVCLKTLDHYGTVHYVFLLDHELCMSPAGP